MMVLGTVNADRSLAAQIARDTTPDGRRRAFVAGAARKSAAVKADYFNRYFADKSLNETGRAAAWAALTRSSIRISRWPICVRHRFAPVHQANRRISSSAAGWSVHRRHTSEAAAANGEEIPRRSPEVPKDLSRESAAKLRRARADGAYPQALAVARQQRAPTWVLRACYLVQIRIAPQELALYFTAR